MTWVLFWAGTFAIGVGMVIDRYDRRLRQARVDLRRRNNMDAGEKATAFLMGQLLPEDRALLEDDEVAKLDAIWEMPTYRFGSSLPMRPARHSHNRLHRGF